MSSFWFVIKQKLTTKEIFIFSNSSHFEWRVGLSDTILKEHHPRTIPAKFALIWFSGFRGKDLNVIFYQNMPNLHNWYKSAERKISHNFERDPPKDHSCQVWFNLVQGFRRRRLKCESLRRTMDGRTDAKWWQKLTWPLARWAKKWSLGINNI